MRGNFNATATCCTLLSNFFGNKTSFPSSQDYESSLVSYFSLQASLIRPSCVLSPETAGDVSNAVRILTHNSRSSVEDGQETCQFAIRSGGHSSEADASNIEGGVTIDLRRLNSIDLNLDRYTAVIGVGNTWDSVYSRLDPRNLSVAGGRTAGVGVGGLSLGGGISYFGPRYGWTSDTIKNFEIVLADASIVNANAESNSALYWALKGGGNNFGIVTSIEMEIFDQGPFWGGSMYFPGQVWADTAREFALFNSANAYDEYASLTLTWGYSPAVGQVVSSNMEYTRYQENPPVFEGLTNIPSLYGSLQISNMTQLAIDLRNQQVFGERQFWATNTFISTEATVNMTYICFNKTLPAFQSVPNITVGYTLEPLPPALYAKYADLNPYGLNGRNESLVIGLFTASWTDAANDDQVENASRALVEAIEKGARELEAHVPFVYLNYAAPWQNPIASYGDDNLERMHEIANEEDPHGVFIHQVPGGFKIGQRC